MGMGKKLEKPDKLCSKKTVRIKHHSLHSIIVTKTGIMFFKIQYISFNLVAGTSNILILWQFSKTIPSLEVSPLVTSNTCSDFVLLSCTVIPRLTSDPANEFFG
jgi:hypothetical protein